MKDTVAICTSVFAMGTACGAGIGVWVGNVLDPIPYVGTLGLAMIVIGISIAVRMTNLMDRIT